MLRPAPKTLHITNAYHETSGGIRTFYHAVMDAANRAGRPIRLVVPAAGTWVEQRGPCARIHHVAAPRAPVVDSRYRLLLPHTYLRAGGVLRRLLREEQPDLVEITDKYTLPWLAGVLRRGWDRQIARPVVVGLSCERLDDNVRAFVTRSAPGGTFARWYMRRLYRPLFDHHLAMSEYIADELRVGLPAAGVTVCTPGVDASAFGPWQRQTAARARMTGPDASPCTRLLLYAGRLSPEKHIPLLLEAFASLTREAKTDYRLAIAGSGPLTSWLERQARAVAPARIRLVPHVTRRAELAALYASADVFVHPNPREPFGMGPLEAMASGCPVVAPRAGGVLTYANDQNAWLAAPNADAMAGAVRAVFEDPARRASRIAAALETARQYDWPAVTSRLFLAYDRLCGYRAAPAADGQLVPGPA